MVCRFRTTRPYVCERMEAERIRDEYLAGTWEPRDIAAVLASRLEVAEGAPVETPRKPYAMAQHGVAVIPIIGAMSKGPSKFAETDTVAVRRALRAAAVDGEVGGIMLYVDSPGGEVAGTMELAEDVNAARKKKHVHAYIEDMGASAAYWVASQAERLTQNAAAIVGSVGVIALLFDDSAHLKANGIMVHVVASGAKKALGAPGQPVTAEDLAEVERLIAPVAAEFFAAVKFGRGWTAAQLAVVTDGGVHRGAEAVALGLTDGVQTWDAALVALSAVAVSEAEKARKGARNKALQRASILSSSRQHVAREARRKKT